jgi:murein DD-endopeptidase MepM/ murein hydrolase activator NlpD
VSFPGPHFGGCLASTGRASRPASGKGLALRWDEEPTGNGDTPDPRRRTSWEAPRELRGPRIPQDPNAAGRQDPSAQDPRRQRPAAPQELRGPRIDQRTLRPEQPRAARPQQQAPERAPRPPKPEQDPRQGTPRPRPGGTATTGQLPVARTRDTAAGPTGTARIPVVRPTAPGPAAPRPGVRQPEGQRPQAKPPVRSRLRTPPAPPQQPPMRPTAPRSFEQLQRPTARPAPVQPFAQLAPAAQPQPLPPTPVDFADAPARTRGAHPGRTVFSLLAVMALALVWGLPAFASEALDPPPVAGATLGGVQHLQVGTDVSAEGATTDSVTGSLVATTPTWMKPVQGHLGDPFGPRPEQPVPGVSLFHRGQDIVAACGEQIHAAASGTVSTATYWGTYGNWILIDHGDGVAVGYAHESKILVSVGEHVTAGQVIGLVGETGAATGCHLHLEVHLNGVAVNPVPFFAAKHISLG